MLPTSWFAVAVAVAVAVRVTDSPASKIVSGVANVTAHASRATVTMLLLTSRLGRDV